MSRRAYGSGIGMLVVAALAACGGAIDYSEVNGTGGTSGSGGSSGGASGSVPTSRPTSSPPAPPVPTDVPGRPPPPPSDDCAISFKADILPIFAANGCTNLSCHGDPSSGAVPPLVSDTDVVGTYTALTTYKILGQPYIDTSGKPASSSIMCNLRSTCGNPMPTFGRVSNKDLSVIGQWLRCYAPLN